MQARRAECVQAPAFSLHTWRPACTCLPAPREPLSGEGWWNSGVQKRKGSAPWSPVKPLWEGPPRVCSIIAPALSLLWAELLSEARTSWQVPPVHFNFPIRKAIKRIRRVGECPAPSLQVFERARGGGREMWEGGVHQICWDPGPDLGPPAPGSAPPPPHSCVPAPGGSTPHHRSWSWSCTQVTGGWPGGC